VESRFARQIGVGQPTVREALVALEHQGLVVRRANQGCVVTSFTRTEIRQMLRIREELETLAVDLAIESAAEREMRQLLDLTVAMKEAARVRDLSRFFDVDVQFHEMLWRMSGNSLLPRLLSQVLTPLLAFLFLRNLRQHRQIDLVESAEAHVELVEAILGRNRERAGAVARAKFAMFAEQHLGWYEQ
jgi:DNA-binding GntR family transcriptional regulator